MMAKRIGYYLFLTIVAIVFLVPVYGAVLTSFRETGDIIKNGLWSLPEKITIKNFLEAWRDGNVGLFTRNTFIITISSVFGVIAFACLSSYPLARLRFKGKLSIYIFIITGMFFPAQLSIVPLFRIMTFINLYDTYLGLILIHIAYGLPFCTFVLTNFLRVLPTEISDAGRIDGASELTILVRIILPLAKPALGTLGILQFTWIWNDFLWALLLTRSQNIQPIMVGIYNLKGQYVINWSVMSAGALLATVPTLIVFIFLQRYFVRGLMVGAVKG